MTFLKIKPFGVRYRHGKNCSSHNGNATTHLLYSSLLIVESTLGILFETEEWLPKARSFQSYSTVMSLTNLLRL